MKIEQTPSLYGRVSTYLRLFLVTIATTALLSPVGECRRASGLAWSDRTELMDAAEALHLDYLRASDAEREKLLNSVDRVIDKVRKSVGELPEDKQTEFLHPLLADRAMVANSRTSIPVSPQFAIAVSQYENNAAKVRRAYRKELGVIVKRLRNADLDEDAKKLEDLLEEHCPRALDLRVFARDMSPIVEKFRREVIENQIRAAQAVEINNMLSSLYGRAQSGAISAVDLAAEVKELHAFVLESKPYNIGNTEVAKVGQRRAYPLVKELESYLASVLRAVE